MRKDKLISRLKNDYASQDCKWVAIEPHLHNNLVVGYYLNTYIDIDLNTTSDTWFEKLEHAKQAALEDYGIAESDWEVK